MGKPLYPIVWDIHMNYFERILLDKYNVSADFFNDDDTFVIVVKNVDISDLISLDDSIELCIQFT